MIYLNSMKQYYPYPANDGKHKYYIITKSGRKVLFGAAGYSDYIKYSKNNPKLANERKQRYIDRHKNNENWGKSGIDTAGFWSRWLLWHLPTIKDSYTDIKKRFLN